MRSCTASPGRYTNTRRHVVLSLRPLVSGSHLFAVLWFDSGPPGVKVVWVGERNEEGGVWYWHRDTRVSTIDLPPLPPG